MVFSKSKEIERNFQIALCTAPDQATAESLAEKMVQQNLAACVNIIPAITSVYQWQGQIEKEPEVLLAIKTAEELMLELEELLNEEHPYEVFELISCNIEQAATAYLQWLNDSV